MKTCCFIGNRKAGTTDGLVSSIMDILEFKPETLKQNIEKEKQEKELEEETHARESEKKRF